MCQIGTLGAFESKMAEQLIKAFADLRAQIARAPAGSVITTSSSRSIPKVGQTSFKLISGAICVAAGMPLPLAQVATDQVVNAVNRSL